MVLDGEGLEFFAADSFVGMIVEVQVGLFNALAFEGIQVDAETVVLAGNFDGTGI